jgi:hypothetical protein
VRKICFVLPVLLLAALTFPFVRADSDLYFLVINDTVYPFEFFSQPWPPGNQGTMIPHTTLTDDRNRLNIRSQWSSEENLFTLFSGNIQLTFNMGQHTAFSGSQRFTAPLLRMGDGSSAVFFLPAEVVCEVFGLNLTTNYQTEWGRMVRITNNNSDDASFVRIFGNLLIKPEYDRYSAVTAPQPSPSAPPQPTPDEPLPTIHSEPPPPVYPSPPESFDVSVYLTFDGAAGDATGAILDILESARLSALFFLPPDSLSGDPALVRRIAARHQAGLLLDGADWDFESVRQGNKLLRETAFMKTWLLRSDQAPPETSEYRHWGFTHRYSPDASAQELINAIRPLLEKTPAPVVLVLSLPHTEAAAQALEELLPAIGLNNIGRVNPGEPPVE